MPKHITSFANSLFGKEQTQDSKIHHFLQAVPHLTFSDKGLKNIARRFNISIEDLKQKIADFDAGRAGR